MAVNAVSVGTGRIGAGNGPSARRDMLAALAAALVSLAMAALPIFRGKALLGDDNDSMLRLVQVRDLLGGQGWYDLTQYRMGLAGGFEMHWSRLVDAPIATLILLAQSFGATPSGAEAFALFAWPALLSVPAFYALMRTARALGGAAALLPASVLGVATLFYSGLFSPGTIDHHSSQATLALLVIMLLASGRSARHGAGAGLCAALMAGIGAETHPHVAAAGLGVALIHLAEGADARRLVAGFGLTFAGSLVAILLATVGPDRLWRTTCDALSIAQTAPGVAGGLALAAAALLTPAQAGFARRTGILAVAAPTVALLGLPHAAPCLGDPLASIDPLVREYWLDAVEEARPLLVAAWANPSLGLGYGVTPLIALAWIGWSLWRGGQPRHALAIAGAAVALSFAIALVQVRGAVLATLFAVAPLSAMVAAARLRAARPSSGIGGQFVMVAAWLASVNLVWAFGGAVLMRAPTPSVVAEAGDPPPTCTESGAFARLAGEPPATVFAISNLGSAILLNTPHRAIAGPYHRNVAGDRAVIEANIASPKDAETLVKSTGATLLVSCPTDAESRFFARRAPAGLIAALARGDIPAWLDPVADESGSPLMIYRIRPAP